LFATPKHGPEAEASFLRAAAAGELHVETLTSADYARMAELVVQYGDLPLGAADASAIAVAERLKITRVATLDHRHFRLVAPKHCATLELIPAEHEMASHRR